MIRRNLLQPRIQVLPLYRILLLLFFAALHSYNCYGGENYKIPNATKPILLTGSVDGVGNGLFDYKVPEPKLYTFKPLGESAIKSFSSEEVDLFKCTLQTTSVPNKVTWDYSKNKCLSHSSELSYHTDPENLKSSVEKSIASSLQCFSCNDTLYMVPGDTCVQPPASGNGSIDRMEILLQGNDGFINLTSPLGCFQSGFNDPGFSGSDSMLVVVCDSVLNLEYCDTLMVIVFSCDSLNCNLFRNVNLSLDQNCSAELNLNLVSQSLPLPSSLYSIQVTDDQGTPHPLTFGFEDLGKRFDVSISIPSCQINSCPIEVLIQDNISPSLICVDDTMTCVEFEMISQEPELIENCQGSTFLLDQRITTLSCDTGFSSIVTQVWIAEDAAGNRSDTCTRYVYISRFPLDNVLAPATSANFYCADVYQLDSEGHPSPIVAGVPTIEVNDGMTNRIVPIWPQSNPLCNILVNYNDTTLTRIGCVERILRIWEVSEFWCQTENRRQFLQIIEIIDSVGPQISIGQDTIIGKPGYAGDNVLVNLPSAIVFDDCSNIDRVDIQYPGGFLSGQNGGQVPLPVGQSLVEYRVYDDCSNSSTEVLTVIIPECDTNVVSLACNDRVHLSLDENCHAALEADMLLEGEARSNNYYSVKAFLPSGEEIQNAILNSTHVGMTLKYRVIDYCSGTSCWGEVVVEDKQIPDLECRDTVIVAQCGESLDPEVVGFPLPMGFNAVRVPGQNEYVVTGFDPCGEVWLRYSDEVVKNGCGADYYTMITRTWSVEDASGNKTSCVEQIGVEPGDFANVVFPPNFDGFGKFALECDFRDVISKSQPVGGINLGWNSLNNGHPSPYDNVLSLSDTLIGTGFPTGTSCDHLAVSYRDRIIETCGENTYKLFRTWKVYDWCTGDDSTHIQAIKVVDTRAPEVLCPTSAPVIVPTTPWECTGSYIVPDPIFDPYFRGNPTVPVILRECNNWTYEIRHKVASVGTMSPDECANVDESETFFTTNVRQLPNGQWEVFDMPQGCNWIKYIITDECGNSVVCGLEVFVEDQESPVAVCDEHTVISLNEDGDAQLCAPVVDNGSQDNCTAYEELTYEIKKMGENDNRFRDCIAFTCADVAISPIMVVFRVYDKAGNYNDCMVEVTVQDKIAPSITCPDNIEISCTQDYLDDNLTGFPDVSDQCGLGKLTSSIVEEELNDCGIGHVIKRWRVEDNGGRFDICDQRIDIVDYTPFNGRDIIWPRDYTVDGCKVIDAHPNNLPDGFGWPDYRNRDCAKPAAGFEDEVFYNVAGYCIKIVRTWEVIDWCQYDAQTGLGGKWTKVQTIYIENNDAPRVIGGCEDQTICADADCDGLVEFELEGTDDCTPSDELEWSYEVREISSGNVVDSGLGNSYSEELSRGRYRFSWTVKDGCANETTCTSDVHIRDCKEPTPYCKPGIVTTIMPSTGYVEIWASDFNDASFDNCTDTIDLRYSFSDDVGDRFRTIYCDDIEGGVVDTFTYEMWVTDLDGNQDYCTVTIIVQDNQDRCPNNGNQTLVVGGQIITLNDEAMEEVIVELAHFGTMEKDTTTNEEGKYLFNDLTRMDPYSITPRKNVNHLNGVSTLDLVLIERHLLGMSPFNNAYQYIAADANNSNNVSAADISEIRKLILGLYSEFPNNTSWRFIDQKQMFTDQSNPWQDTLREQIVFEPLIKNETQTNLIGVKVGDINMNASPNGHQQIQTRGSSPFVVSIPNSTIRKGESFAIVFQSEKGWDLSGMQFTLQMTDEIEIISIQPGKIDVSSSNYHLNSYDNTLALSWGQANSVTLDSSDLLFKIFAKAKEDVTLSQGLEIVNNVNTAEAYTDDLVAHEVLLKFFKNDIKTSNLSLYQNIPNPFNGSTIIPFELKVSAIAKLTIFDTNGASLFTTIVQGKAGYNELTIESDQLSSKGILYYQLESEDEIVTRRMIRL